MNRKQGAAVITLLAIIGLICVASCGNDDEEGGSVGGDLSTRYFDIKDLCYPVDILVDDIIYPPDYVPPEPEDSGGFSSEEAVLAFTRETTGGDATWGDPALIDVRNRILIAHNTLTVLTRVQALLDEIRTTGGLPAYLEAQD